MKTEESYMKMLREPLKLTGEREITSDRSSAATIWTRRHHDTGADQHQSGGKGHTATLRCVLKGKEYIVKTKGIGEPKDSRQRLELLAVLAALSRMVKPSEITIKGSGYIRTGFQYLDTWKKSDWKKSNGKPVANEDLWQLVAEETKIHKITVFLI